MRYYAYLVAGEAGVVEVVAVSQPVRAARRGHVCIHVFLFAGQRGRLRGYANSIRHSFHLKETFIRH